MADGVADFVIGVYASYRDRDGRKSAKTNTDGGSRCKLLIDTSQASKNGKT